MEINARNNHHVLTVLHEHGYGKEIVIFFWLDGAMHRIYAPGAKLLVESLIYGLVQARILEEQS
jgi:hypothetical protein